MLDAVAIGLAVPIAVTAIAVRLGGTGAAVAAAIAGTLVPAALAMLRRRAFDRGWLVRTLDARRRDLEDSADLLFADPASLGPLQRVQRGRVAARLEAQPPPELAAPWSVRRIALAHAAAMLVVAAAVAWPARESRMVERVLSRLGGTAPITATRLVEARLRIAPPAYTGLPPRTQSRLDARAPEGSRLAWMLRLSSTPAAVAVVAHDGRRIPLALRDGAWRGDAILARSMLYRIEVQGAPPLPRTRHRLDAVADRVPQVRVLRPERGLSLLGPGQRRWTLEFEATDDHGVAAAARLRITLAQGSGENITFREQVVTVAGSGPAKRRRYARTLDPAALGLAPGDDLIAQLVVDDRRAPQPQIARSASLILRWPPPPDVETTGLDGMVKRVMPAYFRSQRQIIIDAEALLKEKRRLDAERYLARSDGIGVDQRILRLRYGQFLGEEAQDAPALPTNDAEDAGKDEDGHEDAAGPEKHAHDGEAPAAAPAFGEAGSVLEVYGHTHDEAEAATLLDPETRTTLKAALDQMWQSELHLRQGHPELALPYAYRALGYIKQVQQATRIYLARTGTELPPIDESRRLTGDRAGLADRDDPIAPRTRPDPVLAALWRALDDAPRVPGAVDVAAFERWLRANPGRLRDPLAVVAALDALREDPGCTRCRATLRALLWPLITRPPAPVARRRSDDPVARRYLDALRERPSR